MVISSFFADIFKGNALNNGLLPVQVSESFLDEIFDAVKIDKSTQLVVDLVAQTVTIGNTGISEKFDINSYKKTCMINGYDDIDYLISMKDQISTYENSSKYRSLIA